VGHVPLDISFCSASLAATAFLPVWLQRNFLYSCSQTCYFPISSANLPSRSPVLLPRSLLLRFPFLFLFASPEQSPRFCSRPKPQLQCLTRVGVALLLWGPLPPSQGLANPSKADSAQAAQQAEAAYHQTFQELVEMPSALGSFQHALLLHSWGRFLARWLSAGKAALRVARGHHKGGLSGVHESSSGQALMTM